VVNPAARSDKGSPMCGMPILNADKAKKCFIVKRGDGQGCAGIVNARFFTNNISMVCGDALALLQKMTESVNKRFGLPAAA
jgi:NAD(P) transhydrogenase subunit beta